MKESSYRLEEYDRSLLMAARHNIDRVRNYTDGKPHSRKVVRRLETLMYKIDDLLEGYYEDG